MKFSQVCCLSILHTVLCKYSRIVTKETYDKKSLYCFKIINEIEIIESKKDKSSILSSKTEKNSSSLLNTNVLISESEADDLLKSKLKELVRNCTFDHSKGSKKIVRLFGKDVMLEYTQFETKKDGSILDLAKNPCLKFFLERFFFWNISPNSKETLDIILALKLLNATIYNSELKNIFLKNVGREFEAGVGFLGVQNRDKFVKSLHKIYGMFPEKFVYEFEDLSDVSRRDLYDFIDSNKVDAFFADISILADIISKYKDNGMATLVDVFYPDVTFFEAQHRSMIYQTFITLIQYVEGIKFIDSVVQ